MEKYLNQIDGIKELLTNSEPEEAENALDTLKEMIIYDMALKNSKNKYEKEQLRSAKALLKSASDDRPLFKKMYQVDGTYQMCNGYIAVVLNNIIDGLELNTEEPTGLDCRTVVRPSSGNYVEYDSDYEKVQVDMLDLELKAIKVKKIKDVPIPLELAGRFEETYYNPAYLLMAIKILGTKDVEIYADNSGIRREIFLKSECGEAMVLGLTVPKKVKEEMQDNQ